ncbi:MAG TPA: hypothetical protein VJ227_01910 [Patescibacteria group bacterium]|nr:hypothetical protein [Patescibacteria group bacterium]
MAEFVVPNLNEIVIGFLEKMHTSSPELASNYFGIPDDQATAIIIGDMCDMAPEEIVQKVSDLPLGLGPIEITQFMLLGASEEKIRKLWNTEIPDKDDGPGW